MEYQVELSRRAESDIEEAFLYIQERAPLNAIGWRHGLEAKLRVLERMPGSFELAPESQDATIEGFHLILLLEKKFGKLSPAVRRRIRQIESTENLDFLLLGVLDAPSRQDLPFWRLFLVRRASCVGKTTNDEQRTKHGGVIE